MADRITAVFDTEEQAERAIKDLRDYGITDDRLSVVMRHQEGRGERRPAGEPHGRRATHAGAARSDTDYRGEGDVSHAGREDNEAGGAGRGAAVGAGVGAIFGLAASLIPGIGPFITAGFLANVLGATAGAIVSGAVVGGTAGAVAGALARAGYSEEEASFYGDVVERGGVLVAVDMENSAVAHEQVRRILADHGGRFHGEESARRAA